MDIFDFAGCGQYAQPLRDAVARWGVDNTPEFLGQLTVESRTFTKTRESLAYHADTLLRVCDGRNGVQTLADAARAVAGGDQAVGEALYGIPWGSRLGNLVVGDGFKFRGRGLIQITGRSNYSSMSQRLYGDQRLLSTPELLELAEGAAQSAACFWLQRGLNGMTDVVAITKKVNGGNEALQDRIDATARLLAYNP